MTTFEYKNNILHVENISLKDLACVHGTPLYVYSLSHILDRFNSFTNAFKPMSKSVQVGVHFAMKSNSNQAIVTILAKAGCGMDIVSGGELRRAVSAGVHPDKIIYSGVAKSVLEIRDVIDAGILQINVESVEEIQQINKIALDMGKVASVALRVNPNIDAKTHTKISTGQKTDKFGIDIELASDLYKQMLTMDGLNPCGIAVHLGSQLMSPEPFIDAYKLVAELAKDLMASGVPLKRLDLGGGLGIAYESSDTPPDVNAYCKMVMDTVGDTQLDVHFEPGRWLVGNSGTLIGCVENVKQNDVKTFILGDVGMNDLIRPTLYEAHHDILPVKESEETIVADLVGPVCESGDYMCKNRTLPKMRRGDFFAIMSAGAYGMVQASNYNSRGMPAEVLVQDNNAYLIRPRQTIEDLIDMDIVPEDLDW